MEMGDPSNPLVFKGNGAGHRNMRRVQQLGAVGGRRAEVAVGLGRPTPGRPNPPRFRSPPNFYKRLSTSHVVACLGVPVQTHPKTRSNEFLRIF
jgi:hypothetical protein